MNDVVYVLVVGTGLSLMFALACAVEWAWARYHAQETVGGED